MNQSSGSVLSISAALIESLPGTLLPTGKTLPEREICEVSVEMLPLQHAEHLENFADNFGEGWLDRKNKQLRLQFNLVALFGNEKTEGFWISVPGGDIRISLTPACIASPGVSKKHPELPWAAQSRFVLDEVVELPDWAFSSAKFELLAEVAGRPEKVGNIYISDAFKSQEINSSTSETSASATVALSAVDQNQTSVKNIPPVAQEVLVSTDIQKEVHEIKEAEVKLDAAKSASVHAVGLIVPLFGQPSQELDSSPAQASAAAQINTTVKNELQGKQGTDNLSSVTATGLIESLPGTLLSIEEAPPERKIREISVSMLPLQYSGQLENIADNFGAGWLDSQNKQLRLQFQLVSIFSKARVDELWLLVPDKDEKIALSFTRVDSPFFGQKHPEQPWSGQSRFVVNEFVHLPDWASGSARFDLMVVIAGKPEKVGSIYAGYAFKSRDVKKNNIPETHVSTSPVVSAVAQNTVSEKNNRTPQFARGIIHRIQHLDRLFLFTVLLPTLIASLYFGFIASDIYISESRFLVRTPQHQTSMGLGSLLQSAGFSRSQDDTYSVQDYIFSRDALKQLDTQFALAKQFSSNKVDLFSRFGGLDWDDSFEAFYLYFQKHVTVDLDSTSSISTLSVRAFSPETAFKTNEKLLEMSETLVNQLNEHGKQDMIRFALAEVSVAEQRAKAAAVAISQYRNQKGIFDPAGQSALQLQEVSKIQEELIADKIQLAQIRSQARDNPQIPALQKRIETLQAESANQTAKVVGGERSLSHQSPEYEGLQLELGFAGKQLEAALTSLEQARNDAVRQQLYLERIAQPNKPDVAMEPRRIRGVLATFVLGLIAWGILTMLISGIREHQD